MSLMQLFLRLMLDTGRPPVHRRRKKGERGFTLTELMVVIFIIGLLATVVMINVLPSQDRAMVTKAKADIATLETALEQYRLDNLTYPTSTDGLNALVTAWLPAASPHTARAARARAARTLSPRRLYQEAARRPVGPPL